MTAPERDIGVRYRSVRERLAPLLAGLDDAAWRAPVPATPGWCVKDVLAHLVGNLEDGAAGRIQGPPSPAQTAEQVARHRVTPGAELLDLWRVYAEVAEERFGAGGRWPVFLDALSHEHDVREALDQPGERDHLDVRVAARVLTGDATPVDPDPGVGGPAYGLRVRLDDDGPVRFLDGPGLDAELHLDSYTWLRLRMGRLTREQVAALDWTGDGPPPGEALDRLFVFGPAPS